MGKRFTFFILGSHAISRAVIVEISFGHFQFQRIQWEIVDFPNRDSVRLLEKDMAILGTKLMNMITSKRRNETQMRVIFTVSTIILTSFTT